MAGPHVGSARDGVGVVVVGNGRPVGDPDGHDRDPDDGLGAVSYTHLAAALAVASTDANSAATAQELVTTAITDSKTALDDYMESLKDAGMVQLTANQAARDFEAAIDNAAESLKRNGKTLDIHTPKGRANAEALDAIARAAQDSAEAIYKQTGNQDAAKASLEKGRIALINAAIQMGMTKTAAEKYAESVLKIPATVSTKASLDTREAMAKRNDLLSPGVLRITAHISGTNLDKMYGRGYADGGIVKRADGGIDGNGTYVDRVPQVARRRNILWGETDIPWEAYISGKPEMREMCIRDRADRRPWGGYPGEGAGHP